MSRRDAVDPVLYTAVFHVEPRTSEALTGIPEHHDIGLEAKWEMTENICSEVGVRELGLELRMLEEYRHAMSARCSQGYRPRSGLVLTSDILMDDRQDP